MPIEPGVESEAVLSGQVAAPVRARPRHVVAASLAAELCGGVVDGDLRRPGVLAAQLTGQLVRARQASHPRTQDRYPHAHPKASNSVAIGNKPSGIGTL